MKIIYGLCDKRERVRYVGAAADPARRLVYHLSNAKSGIALHLPIVIWLKAQIENGYRPRVLVLERANNERWERRERYWIRQYRKRSPKLLNLTDGGYGLRGHKFKGSLHAQKISDARRSGRHFNCITCDTEFWRKPSAIEKGDCKFCSRVCFQQSLVGVSKTVSRLFTERGVAASAEEKKSHKRCKHGHLFSKNNVRMRGNTRICKTCVRLNAIKHRKKFNA